METSELYQEKDLLPTPTATDSQEGKRKSTQVKPGSKHSVTLKQADGLLPKSTSLQEDFLASPSPRPENEEARMMTAFSGRKCSVSLKNSGRLGSLAKMLLGSSRWSSRMVRLEWQAKTLYSVSRRTKSEITTLSPDELNESFDRSAMKPFGLLYQLAPSVLPTEEIESGLLPTPRVSEAEGSPVKNVEMKNGKYSRKNKQGVRYGVKVKDVLAMLPTPKVGAIDDTNERSLRKGNLHAVVHHGSGTGLKLQPNFVEWMMGYPQNWTDLNCPNQNIG